MRHFLYSIASAHCIVFENGWRMIVWMVKARAAINLRLGAYVEDMGIGKVIVYMMHMDLCAQRREESKKTFRREVIRTFAEGHQDIEDPGKSHFMPWPVGYVFYNEAPAGAKHAPALFEKGFDTGRIEVMDQIQHKNTVQGGGVFEGFSGIRTNEGNVVHVAFFRHRTGFLNSGIRLIHTQKPGARVAEPEAVRKEPESATQFEYVSGVGDVLPDFSKNVVAQNM